MMDSEIPLDRTDSVNSLMEHNYQLDIQMDQYLGQHNCNII